MSALKEFEANLHHTTKVLGYGTATVMEKTVDAIWVKNLYGQVIVWGMFSIERGKFKGKLANDANTEGVKTYFKYLVMDLQESEAEKKLVSRWMNALRHIPEQSPAAQTELFNNVLNSPDLSVKPR
jgi:hypothetical protein